MNTQSLPLSTKHMTMELGFIPSRGIFALRSSDHTSRTISQFSQKSLTLNCQRSKHFMMLYASLKESQRINYTTFSTSCKWGMEKFFIFSTHRKSSNHLTLDLWFIVIRGRLVQTSSVFPYRMPITGHRNSYSIIKGQIPYGKCCSCFTQRFNYTISSFPTQGGFWNFYWWVWRGTIPRPSHYLTTLLSHRGLDYVITIPLMD